MARPQVDCPNLLSLVAALGPGRWAWRCSCGSWERSLVPCPTASLGCQPAGGKGAGSCQGWAAPLALPLVPQHLWGVVEGPTCGSPCKPVLATSHVRSWPRGCQCLVAGFSFHGTHKSWEGAGPGSCDLDMANLRKERPALARAPQGAWQGRLSGPLCIWARAERSGGGVPVRTWVFAGLSLPW